MDPSPPIGGSLEECFRHFIESHDLEPAANLLGEITETSSTTIIRWSKGSFKPNGLKRIVLRVVLDAAGYRVDEYYELPLMNRRLHMMLALKLMTRVEISRYLGFPDTDEGRGLYKFCLYGKSLEPIKLTKIKQLGEENKDLLKEGFEELQLQLRDIKLDVETTSMPAPSLQEEGRSANADAVVLPPDPVEEPAPSGEAPSEFTLYALTEGSVQSLVTLVDEINRRGAIDDTLLLLRTRFGGNTLGDLGAFFLEGAKAQP